MNQILEQCANRNLALNATHAAYSLYVSQGFTSEGIVYMRQGEAPQLFPPTPPPEGKLTELSNESLSEITSLDARAFGSDRSSVLAALSADATISVLHRCGEAVGYSICREFGGGFVIGPIVAQNDQDAVHLAAAHLKKLQGRLVRVDTRERSGVFATFLEKSGLVVGDSVTTMSIGRRFLNREGNGLRVFGLAGHALS